MKRVVGVAALAVLGLLAVLVANTLGQTSRQVEVEPAPRLALDAEAAAARLGEALRFETVSYQEPARFPAGAFEAFRGWLAARYPRLHRKLRRELINDHSLLFTWQGSDPSLEPLVLLAHQDVVPVPSPERWQQPPFSGALADGFVWGRGAMDDKGSLVAICEAVERLLVDGFAPERSVLLFFGHDEELGGPAGAKAAAQRLADRGLRAWLVLDEGMAVVEGVLPGFERALGLVGVAEKGSATLELVVNGAGGHSSTPPRHTAAGILASAVHRVEASPLPAHIDGVTRDLFAHLAPELPWPPRIVLSNLWLFGGLVERAVGESPAMNALLRTTTAVTILESGVKRNVLPQSALAVVNFRILPGETADDVMEHVRRAVDDPRVELRFQDTRNPSPVSPAEGPAWEALTRSIGELFPEALISPALVLGGTDARHFKIVSDAVYRFGPFRYGPEDLARTHGTDERLSVEGFADGIRFYERFVRNAQPR